MLRDNNMHKPPQGYAAELGRGEFDPMSETHHFGFVVKSVNPGCTMEMQIEEADGRVTRITTTENSLEDYHAMKVAVMAAFDRFLQRNPE